MFSLLVHDIHEVYTVKQLSDIKAKSKEVKMKGGGIVFAYLMSLDIDYDDPQTVLSSRWSVNDTLLVCFALATISALREKD